MKTGGGGTWLPPRSGKIPEYEYIMYFEDIDINTIAIYSRNGFLDCIISIKNSGFQFWQSIKMKLNITIRAK